jgi:hypothetical protein
MPRLKPSEGVFNKENFDLDQSELSHPIFIKKNSTRRKDLKSL